MNFSTTGVKIKMAIFNVSEDIGQQLYYMYVTAQLELNNCTVDTWEQLSEEDKAVWEKVAEDFYDSM